MSQEELTVIRVLILPFTHSVRQQLLKTPPGASKQLILAEAEKTVTNKGKKEKKNKKTGAKMQWSKDT